MHEKVSKLGNLSDAEAVLVDDCLILVRDFGDTNIIVVANQYENELLLLDFLNALHTVVGNIAAGQSKAAVLECLDKIFVMLDEVRIKDRSFVRLFLFFSFSRGMFFSK